MSDEDVSKPNPGDTSDLPKDEPQPNQPASKIENILNEAKKFWTEKINAIDYTKFANISGSSIFTELLSFANGKNTNVNIDVSKLMLQVGKESITLRNEFFDTIKTGLEHLFNSNGGDFTKLTNVIVSNANSIDELVKDKVVLKFVEFLKNIATINEKWAEILVNAFKNVNNIEVKIDFDKNEIFVKTSETEFTNLLTFKPEFINGFKEIFKTLMKTVIVNLATKPAEKILASSLSDPLFNSLWSGIWIISKIEGRNLSIKKITDENLKKNLQTSINSLEEKIKTVSVEDQKLSKVKKAIDNANLKIIEAKNFVASNKFEYFSTKNFIDSLKILSDEIDQHVANVTNDLTQLISNIGNSFEIKSGDASTMLPSTITIDKLQMQESKKLENQVLTFTTESYDEFGKVLVSGNIKYGDVTREFSAVPLSINFQKTNNAYNIFLNNIVRDIVDTKNKSTRAATIKTDLAAVKDLQAKITEFLALTDQKYQDILKDNVALYLWAEEASKNKTVDKDTALQTVKTNFLNKPDGNDFSKLDYLTETSATGRWTKLEKLIKLFVFANNPKALPSTDTAAMANKMDLMPYKDSKFIEFIKGFYNDFISKYFTPNTKVTNNKWVLFEFAQPWFTTRMFLLLEDKLTTQQKQMTFQTLNRFTNSISNYGSIEGTNSPVGTKLIDNFTHFSRIFFVRNWLNLYTQNIKEALKDAQDYKK